MLCDSGEYCCLSFANWVVFLQTWTFLLVICLLHCVPAGVDCLAVVCRAHPSSLAPRSLLHCNIPPQMFAEHSDQRWMLKWAGAHLSPPNSAFLLWGMAQSSQADSCLGAGGMTPEVCFLTLGLDHPLWSAFWLGGSAIAPGVPLTWWGGVRQLCFCYSSPLCCAVQGSTVASHLLTGLCSCRLGLSCL